jgi:type VI secretion system protein ImpF
MSERGDRDRGKAADLQARLPLLDRLIDDAPEQLREPPPSAAEIMARLRRSVRRDLEALLNARRRWRSWPDQLDELALSPVGWGIADFSAGAFNDRRRRDELRAEIEATIRRFDPRLANVRVSLLDGREQLDPTLCLRIDALLLVEPAPEPVAFDTLIDAATAEVVVRQAAETPEGTASGV